MLFRLLLVLLTIVISQSFLWSQGEGRWITGIVHSPHATDGWFGLKSEDVVKAVEKQKCDFLIMTEHFNNLKENKNGYNFANYRDKFKSDKMVVVYGVEIEGLQYNNQSHTLVLGDFDPEFWKENYCPQKKILDGLKGKYLLVAAHPNTLLFPFDKIHIDGINGVEHFNDEINTDIKSKFWYEKTLEWQLILLKEKRNIFVTAGCDLHYIIKWLSQKKTMPHITCKTYVYLPSNEISKENILQGFKNGSTYASWDNLTISDTNYIPGFDLKDVKRPNFKINLKFDEKTKEERIARVWTDGFCLKSSEQIIPKGKKEYCYEWKDLQTKVGEHWYMFEVEGKLVTSPFKLNILSPITSDDYYNQLSPQAVGCEETVSDFLNGKGQKFAYLSDKSGSLALYTKDTKKKYIEKICSMEGYVANYGFSPNGHVLLVNESSKDIYMLKVDLNNRAERRLINLKIKSSLLFFPIWVNDESFYYVPLEEGKVLLANVTFETVDLGNHINGTGLGGLFDVLKVNTKKEVMKVKKESAEGLQFITSSVDDHKFTQICLIGADLKVISWLTKGAYNNDSPSVASGGFAPIGNSTLVAFKSDRSGNYDIYTMMVKDGKTFGEKRITNFSGDEFDPAWLYNNSKIIYSSKAKDGQSRLLITDYKK